MSLFTTIQRQLIRWYSQHKRDHLPWRYTRDPYHILVSEVMLQQTQVDRVIPKYQEFLRLFPTVQSLALAPSSRVIIAWQGLGYNRRALYLQKTAQTVVRDFNGVFPQDLETLKILPGVGDYTARAILSFAFEKAVPMMDTNHRRFYQRVFFGARKLCSDEVLLTMAEKVLPKKHAYDWNQALMDFGSIVCTTKNPSCNTCPLNKMCKAAFMIEKVSQKKKKATVRFKDSDRYVRGRIIELLRVKNKIKEAQLLMQFPDHDTVRLKRIIEKLIHDRLIHRAKDRIVLGGRT